MTMVKTGGRVLGLDGLRGLAILLVIVSHFFGETLNVSGLLHTLTRPAGGIGVELFFVLSGFLITTIIVREQLKSGTIDLKKFYIRRSLRIWPAFYTFIGVMAVLAVTGVLDVTSWELIASGLFIWDYAPGVHSLALTHTWSIAIEEQFYLIWPAIALWLKPKKALWVCLAGLAIVPFLRVATYFVVDQKARETIWQMLHVRADSLLMGCLLALVLALRPEVWVKIQRVIVKFRLVLLAVPVLVGSGLLAPLVGGAWQMTVGYSIENLALAVLIIAVMTEGHPLNVIMSWRPLVWVGTISFSLYLWQQLFLVPTDTTSFLPPFVALLASFAAAILSYVIIEKPVLKFKKRFEVARFKGAASRIIGETNLADATPVSEPARRH
ncbi:acyltransferase family protein [Pseudarthrobacter sp. MDT1-22]